MDVQDIEEGRFIEDVVSIRDCPGPVTEVVGSDGSRRAWLGRALKGCGRRYTTPDARRLRKALACPTCADKPAFKVLLDLNLDPHHWAI
jgi:hypothetical protein